MIRNYLFILFICPIVLLGQVKEIPLTVSLFNESTAIPFTRFFTTPIHPGIQMGTEFNYRLHEHTRLFQTANISYFYHDHLEQGIGLNTELGYSYRFGLGIEVSGLIGVGYLHTFTTEQEFTLVNGHYIHTPDKGNARMTPSLSFDIGYNLLKAEKDSPQIFIRYQSWAEYPFSPDFIPIMSHINLHLGAKFFIDIADAK